MAGFFINIHTDLILNPVDSINFTAHVSLLLAGNINSAAGVYNLHVGY